jgi:hypothetical protein
MGMLPPLQVSVDVRSWSVILDVRLALHRLGLMMATRLAEELRVFLVPTLWEVLDNTAYLNHHPERLAEGGLSESEAEAGLALAQWERARLELGLSALHIFWAGDALHESSLPKDMDPGLSERFSYLAEGLSRRMGEEWNDQEIAWPLHEGCRDAVALAAAMIRYRPVILTLCEQAEEPPHLCKLLHKGGIQCRQITTMESQPMCDYLRPMLARSGVLELAWDGLQLAMVHLVAPQAMLMIPPGEDEGDPFTGRLEKPDPWSSANAYWYGLK